MRSTDPLVRSQIGSLLTAAARMLTPPPSRNAGQWADQKRVAAPDSPEPGPWRTDRTPYMWAIYDAWEDPAIEQIAIVMGAQMSKTEGLINMLLKTLDDGPRVPSMYVGPTQNQVESMGRDRIEKVLREIPSLWDITAKGQRLKVKEKWIAGTRLGLAWAGSPTELASHPVARVVVDEIDRMTRDVGGEGDPLTLVKARTKNYRDRKICIASTPTREGESAIWSLFTQGTMQVWYWHCMHCTAPFMPRLDLLRWPKGATPSQARAQAYVVCPHCGAMHYDSDRRELNAGGAYVPHEMTDNGLRPIEQAPPNATASFWVHGLCSPWREWGAIAEALVAAYETREEPLIQAVVNVEGGEVFRVEGDAPDWTAVLGLQGQYQEGQVVDSVQIITAGVDVQKLGLYYVIRGWGYGMESWLIERGYVAGDTATQAPWDILSRIVGKTYVNGRGALQIRRAFVDSGYRPGDPSVTPRNMVYEFCRLTPNAMPSKGQDSMNQPLRASNIDITVSGVVRRGALQLWHIDTDDHKSWVYQRIRWPEGQPGGWHVFDGIDDEYARQVTAEQQVIKSSGRVT